MAKDIEVVREPVVQSSMDPVAFTVRLPRWLHEELRDGAHNERKSMNAIIAEGAVLRLRGSNDRDQVVSILNRLGYNPLTQEDLRHAG